MIKFFVKNPITTVMFVLLWVVLGIVAYPKMNIERTPAIDFPMVTASFIYPGASPDEVESQVIKKTENVMSEVSGIKKITSQAYENGGYVMAEFNLGVNVNDKASEIKAKLESIEGEFPDDLKKPVVEKLNPLQESVMDIVLSGADVRTLEHYVDDVLSRQITGINGVASVSVYGGDKRAIRVYLNPEQMAARGLAINEVVAAIAAHNLNVPGGKLELGDSSNVVRFVGEFNSVNDIKNLQMTTPEGAVLRLRDIARIEDSALDKTTGARLNGQPVVITSVVKASDGNAIKISKELRQKMPAFEKEMQNHFAKTGTENPVAMQIISDSSIAIQHETNTTVRDIILGLALTVLTLIVFTRNWRTTIIAGVMIPASLVAGFFWMDASGFTINAMTLLAIATALGTLITDAIVLIESALGLIEQGYTPEDAAVTGTKKVAVRIFATIATHVVVFLPLAFMGGIAGQFMKQFGLSVVYLVLISSMFSFTLTPMMIAKILKGKKPGTKNQESVKKKDKKTDSLSWFRKFYDWQINKPWQAVGVAAAVLVLSLIPMRWVGNEFAGSTDVNEINIFARGDAGSTFKKSESIAADIENRLSKIDGIDFVSVKIGDRGVQNINIKVGLVDRSDRSKSDKQIAREIVPAIADIPGVETQVRAGAGMSGAVSNDLIMNINGEDDAKREAYATQVLDMLNNIPEIQTAVPASQKPGRELKFVPSDEKMKLWGVRNATAASALRTALYGNDTYKYKENGDEYPIVLELAPEYKNYEMFDSVYVGTAKGLVALSELGELKPTTASPTIRRIDKNRITEIDINIGKSTIGPVQAKIQSELKKIDWEQGYYASFGGMSEMQAESTGEIGNAFLLATILTFMALAAIMNSLRHPFTIVTSILTSFAGVFILLFLVGGTINIAAMMSLVMLVGLAVSTNILILEPTLEEMKAGKPAREALWEQFIDKKRMLVMATVAVVAGLLPQLWAPDDTKVAMGAVIIGGILASLFWTFFLTPAVFTLMERIGNKKKK